jgi:hypothetical protein
VIRSALKTSFIVVSVLALELLIYSVFIEPVITGWGATAEEHTMDMAGDSPNQVIASTRAIDIDAPQAVVWQWLMQLGADRAGFYSYDFIESALGYHTTYPDMDKPRFEDLKPGDVVRGSNNDADSVIPYNFPVLFVQPQETFVLDNWGSFLLEAKGDKARLIIRTQEKKSDNLSAKIAYHLAIPFHFLMERRMLLGLKMRAEEASNLGYSRFKDMLWFACVALSWFLIVSLVFVLQGRYNRVIVPSIIGAIWLTSVFLLPPMPVYPSIVLLITLLSMIYLRKGNRDES